MKHTDEELNTVLEQLANATRSPQGKYSSAASYKKLEKRLFPKRTYTLYSRIAASAAAVVLLCALGWSLYQHTTPARVFTISTLAETRTIQLPDGTEVVLNHFTSISYPEKFDKKNREVALAGEAYFEVAKDKEHPFIVQTETVDVQVLGTHFNVEAYSKDPEVKTTLLEGSVAVSNKNKSERMVLRPNESAIYNKLAGNLTLKVTKNALDEVVWRENMFIFNNRPVKEIMRELSNSFGVTIQIDDPNVREYKMNARFANDESLDDILQLLQSAGNFSYTRTGETIRITSAKN